ncbi:MAG TPA: type II toxin-antitoxin system RelE/ParE family toxin [Thermoplasmata archaeon]
MYRIEFTSSAEKAFRRLPRAVRRRFSVAFELLRQDPRRRRPGCDVRLLSGVANAWRLRVGDYRGIFAIEESSIVFTRFGHRKDVYRR